MAHSAGVAVAASSVGSISSFKDVVSIPFQNSKKILIISLIAQTFLAALKTGLAVSFSLKNLHSIMILPFAIVAFKGVAITLLVVGLISILNKISLEVLKQSYRRFLKNEELSKCWDKHFISHYSNQQKMNTYFSVVNGVFYSIVPMLSVALLPSILLSVVNALRAINYNPIELRNKYYAKLLEYKKKCLKRFEGFEGGDRYLMHILSNNNHLVIKNENDAWEKVNANARIRNKPFSDEDRVDGVKWKYAMIRLEDYFDKEKVWQNITYFSDNLGSRLASSSGRSIEEETKTRIKKRIQELENSEQRAWVALEESRRDLDFNNYEALDKVEISGESWEKAIIQLNSFVTGKSEEFFPELSMLDL